MLVEEKQVLEKLKTVIDPEIGINIVDLGLIYSLDISANQIVVTMTLTTPGCPMHNSISKWAEESLSGFGKGIDVKINLVWEPRWTPDKMSGYAKNLLGM